MRNKSDWIDPDIEALELEYTEKSGLQVFRNYQRAFTQRAIKEFGDQTFSNELDLTALERVLEILTSEDVRFLPIVVCSYADEALRKMFLDSLPSDVPGGVKNLVGGYGPLSDFSKRIKMAFSFDLVSKELLNDLDRMRKLRNRLSHDWDLAEASAMLAHPSAEGIFPVEAELGTLGLDTNNLGKESEFRVRLAWLLGRLTYEASAYHKAKYARIDPIQALYASERNEWIAAIAKICHATTQAVIEERSVS